MSIQKTIFKKKTIISSLKDIPNHVQNFSFVIIAHATQLIFYYKMYEKKLMRQVSIAKIKYTSIYFFNILFCRRFYRSSDFVFYLLYTHKFYKLKFSKIKIKKSSNQDKWFVEFEMNLTKTRISELLFLNNNL